MKVKYVRWGRGFGRHTTEEATLSMLDGFNQTRYSRRKNKEGLLEIASREAHEQKKVYYATVFDGETPYCFLECNDGYFYVGFLDEKLRVYMSYKFYDDLAPSEKLFLHSVSYFEFDNQINEIIRRTDYLFETNGDFQIIIYEEDQQVLTPDEPLSPEVVKHLWVNYPEFGKYDELIKIDRVPPEVFEQFPNVNKS